MISGGIDTPPAAIDADRVKKSVCFVLFSAIFLLSPGCTIFTPDEYLGDGVWMRGDGTTFEAPPPIAVTDARIVGQEIDSRMRIERTESTEEDGKTVIREREYVEIETGMDVEIELDDGSRYAVFLQGAGRINELVSVQSSFVGPNGYPYSVSGGIYQSLDRPRLLLEIKSRGGVHYRNTLMAP